MSYFPPISPYKAMNFVYIKKKMARREEEDISEEDVMLDTVLFLAHTAHNPHCKLQGGFYSHIFL